MSNLAEVILKIIAKHDFQLNIVTEKPPTGDDYNKLSSEITNAIPPHVEFDVADFINAETRRLQTERDVNKGRDEIASVIKDSVSAYGGLSHPTDGVMFVIRNGERFKIEVSKL